MWTGWVVKLLLGVSASVQLLPLVVCKAAAPAAVVVNKEAVEADGSGWEKDTVGGGDCRSHPLTWRPEEW